MLLSDTNREQIKNIVYNLLPFAVLLGMMLALHRFITLDLSTDDLYFSTIQDRFTLLEFLQHRYQRWSGRLSGEALIYSFLKYDLRWWKLVNSLLIVLLCYGLTALLLGERFWLRNYRDSAKTAWFICLGLGWINMNILGASMFWVTGSFAYLWMIAAASIALIPVRERIFGEPLGGFSGAILKLIYLACAAVASLGNEQVSLVLVSLILLANLRIYHLKKRVDGYLVLMLLVVLIGSAILFSAPGNNLRVEQEISTSLTEFRDQTWLDKGLMGVKWLMHKTFNVNRVLMILLLALLSLTYVLHSGSETRNWFGGVTAAFALLLFLTTINLDLLNRNSQEQWFDLLYNFRSAEKIITAFNKAQQWNFSVLLYLLPYIIWGGALMWITLGLYYTPEVKPLNGVTLSLVYLGALGTLVILFFTPAMTLSANRILATASIMLLWIAAALFHSIADRIPLGWLILTFLIPVMSIVYQALEWQNGYSVLW